MLICTISKIIQSKHFFFNFPEKNCWIWNDIKSKCWTIQSTCTRVDEWTTYIHRWAKNSNFLNIWQSDKASNFAPKWSFMALYGFILFWMFIVSLFGHGKIFQYFYLNLIMPSTHIMKNKQPKISNYFETSQILLLIKQPD